LKEFKFVGFWQRVVMYLFDLMIISGIIFIVSQIFRVKYTSKEDIGYIVFVLARISIIIPALYTLTFWKLKGATPGKIIRMVKIVDPKTGEIPKLWRLIIRYLCYPISKSLFFLGFIWIGLDSRKQAWHDKIAGTVVIKPNILKIPKDISYDFPIKEGESFFPFSPTKSDVKKWKIGKILVIFSLLSLFTLTWFFSDDPLWPESKDWLYEPAFVENKPEDNGFYYLLGAFTPKDSNSFEIGYQWVQNQNSVILEHKNSEIYDNIDTFPEFDMNINYQEMTTIFKSDSLLQYCLNNKENIINNYKEYSYFNERLKDVFEHNYFKNTLIPHISGKLPIFIDLAKFSLLKKFYIILLYNNNESEKAINLLNEDLVYDRLLAEKADFLILKLLSSFLLERDLKTYNILHDNEKGHNEKLNQMISKIKPISTSERDMYKISNRIFIENLSTYLNIFNRHQNIYKSRSHHLTKDVVKNSKSIIFKPHKTINREFFAQFSLVKFSQMDGKDFAKLSKRIYLEKPSTLDYLNNFWGSILTSISVPIYKSYIAKFYDIDGYINMLKLKMLIIDQDISAQQIPIFIESQSDSLFNPYTEEALEWDSENSILYFDGPYDDDDKTRKIGIEL
jgi:uncharacterized RDD family membrane protein YckC